MHTSVGLLSYNAAMTFAELWRAVGRELRDVRERQGKKWNHVAKDTTPRLDSKTQQDIERGEPGMLETVERYAQALGLSSVDVLSGS